jgi:hypothetical protein
MLSTDLFPNLPEEEEYSKTGKAKINGKRYETRQQN